MNDSNLLRDNLEQVLNGIQEEMLQKKQEDRVPYLKGEIQKWEQKILSDRIRFRRLIHEGELNIDPEVFENELDEEGLAIGRLYIWIQAIESDTKSDSEFNDDAENMEIESSESNEPAQDDQYMKIEQLAKYIKLSKSQIYTLSSEGEIPRIKVGSRIRFDKDEIDKWMRSKRFL